MKDNSQDVLTVGVFKRLLAEEISREISKLDQKMMAGFEAVFRRFDEIDNKLYSLEIRKADREDVLLVEKRVTKLEEKSA